MLQDLLKKDALSLNLVEWEGILSSLEIIHRGDRIIDGGRRIGLDMGHPINTFDKVLLHALLLDSMINDQILVDGNKLKLTHEEKELILEANKRIGDIKEVYELRDPQAMGDFTKFKAP